MRGGHVVRWLAAYAEGVLGEAERQRVEDHLERCRRCRQRLREVERGAALASGLGPLEPPKSVAARLAAAAAAEAVEAPSPDPRRRAMTGPRVVAAAAVAVAVVAAVLLWRAPSVRVVTSRGAPQGLEALAADTWGELAAGQLTLDLRTEDPAVLRRWLRQRDLDAALASERPATEASAFQLRGVRDLSRPGAPAAAVVYRIAGRDALLVTGRQADAPEVPRWSLTGKRVRFRHPPGGAKLLSWSNSGKAYVLASELPALGQRGCLICHTDAPRRRLVERLAADS
ncbi:MAG TPA: zf-HC2 domain-containing protein [Thermoanaerobaculia bacterium]|nr:zf-HC2 domain-containing protein [Thermoanaerobaculia bacterium]